MKSEAVESGSLVAEATEAESQLTESGSSNNELSPTSELATGALPELAMLEPGAPQLEELEGNLERSQQTRVKIPLSRVEGGEVGDRAGGEWSDFRQCGGE